MKQAWLTAQNQAPNTEVSLSSRPSSYNPYDPLPA